MEKKKYDDIVVRIKELLAQKKAVFFGCHTNDFFNFVGRAIQLTGYFAHVGRVMYVETNDDIMCVEADGYSGRVKWTKFSDYKARITTDSEQLTIGYFDVTERQLKLMDLEARSQIGHFYNMKENAWHALTTIVSWLGVKQFKSLGKLIAGELETVNPLYDKNSMNCSDSCTRQARAGEINILPKDKNSAAVTPTEFMTCKELGFDCQSLKN